MESNDYRLERWLAILLSLLFFLPFVARADEIVHPDFYVDEVPYKDGDAYLALDWDWYPTLWLSSAAGPNQLVGRADLAGTVGGC